MTRQAFIQSKKRNGFGVVLPGFAALAVAVVLPFVWYVIQLVHPDLPLTARVVGPAVCVAAIGLGVWLVYVHLRRVEDRQRHWCPQCRKGFGGTEDIVLRTGRCHYCGSQVIHDA